MVNVVAQKIKQKKKSGDSEFPLRFEIKILVHLCVFCWVTNQNLIMCLPFRKKRKKRVRGPQRSSVWRPAPALQSVFWTGPGQTQPSCRDVTEELKKKRLSDRTKGGITGNLFSSLVTASWRRRPTQRSTWMWRKAERWVRCCCLLFGSCYPAPWRRGLNRDTSVLVFFFFFSKSSVASDGRWKLLHVLQHSI